MHPGLCDGLPVSYSASDSTGDDHQRTCATQSSDNTGDLCILEGFYSPSPSLHPAETTQACPRQSSHFPPAVSTAAQTYPIQQVLPIRLSTDQWPTPPPTSCEDFEEYTYKDSPTSLSCGGPPITSLLAGSSVASPRSWSPAEFQQFPFQPALWKGQEALSYTMQTCPGISSEDQFPQQTASPSCVHTGFGAAMETDSVVAMEAPDMTPDPAESALSEPSISPSPKTDFKTELDSQYDVGDEDAGAAAGALTHGGSAMGGGDGPRVDKPYAQLIYKAFMSRDRHAMTLQEIYQWFRDNTEKAKAENKGWQNSIRHNLSMNKAFVKRDKKPAPGDPLTDSGEPKKSTEWVLEEWAVHEGVQSTTRYRPKNNSGRRGPSGSHPRGHQGQHLSARASSGRKGGITASRTRSAASRSALRKRRYGEIMSSQLPSSNYQRPPSGYFSPHLGLEYASVRGEPATPPDTSAGNILFHDTMHGQVMSAGNAHGYYFGPAQAHRHVHQAAPPQPYPGPDAYRLDHVAAVYEAPSGPQATGPSDPSQLSAHLPSGFGGLFCEDMGDAVSGSASVRVANLQYNWGGSSQFQS